MANKTGGATGTVYRSPAKAARAAKARRREEREWAARSGPVTVRKLTDSPTEPRALPDVEEAATRLLNP